jgi:sugar phosphate isomerase/epimerase
MADVFHMNIDESDMAAALLEAGDMLAYVHLADNQRFEPGTGHLDFEAVFEGLARIGYAGWASLECNLSGDWDSTLPAAIAFLREAAARAATAIAADAPPPPAS